MSSRRPNLPGNLVPRRTAPDLRLKKRKNPLEKGKKRKKCEKSLKKYEKRFAIREKMINLSTAPQNRSQQPAESGGVTGGKQFNAHVAQLVERILGKDEVFGPIPNAGSTFHKA